MDPRAFIALGCHLSLITQKSVFGLWVNRRIAHFLNPPFFLDGGDWNQTIPSSNPPFFSGQGGKGVGGLEVGNEQLFMDTMPVNQGMVDCIISFRLHPSSCEDFLMT